MKQVPQPGAQSLPPASERRRARFSLAALALPILGAAICAVAIPLSERRPGEMFSTGLLLCLFSSVGGAIVGSLLAVVALLRRESPVALAVAALLLNAAIIVYAYS